MGRGSAPSRPGRRGLVEPEQDRRDRQADAQQQEGLVRRGVHVRAGRASSGGRSGVAGMENGHGVRTTGVVERFPPPDFCHPDYPMWATDSRRGASVLARLEHDAAAVRTGSQSGLHSPGQLEAVEVALGERQVHCADLRGVLAAQLVERAVAHNQRRVLPVRRVAEGGQQVREPTQPAGSGARAAAPAARAAAERLQLKHHSVVELINRAQQQYLVERGPDPDDARAIRVQLTADVKRALGLLSALHRDELRRMGSALTPSPWPSDSTST